ncbi:MAG: phosphomethylpyrimidine synthase ThiC, partial [Candidatus Omnitrophica bacterium]|nr:phosphomethylpyrimidine synthase ThiC [Candidatus Omnitrophota bacterium]
MFKQSFLKDLAKKEAVPLAFLKKQLDKGRVVIPLNKKRNISKPCAVGEGLKIKINTNVGLSTKALDIKTEIDKVKCAIKYGTDTIMDLSVSDNLVALRKQLLKKSSVPLGTVPIYEIALEAQRRRGKIEDITFDDIWDVLKKQAEDGVDFFTIHAGILKKNITMLKRRKRVGGVVSRGGALLTYWMSTNKKENPFYTNFDK